MMHEAGTASCTYGLNYGTCGYRRLPFSMPRRGSSPAVHPTTSSSSSSASSAPPPPSPRALQATGAQPRGPSPHDPGRHAIFTQNADPCGASTSTMSSRSPGRIPGRAATGGVLCGRATSPGVGGRRKKKHRRLKEKLTCGPHTSVSEGEKHQRVFWTIRKYTGLRVGSRASKTYKMARFKEWENCNDKFRNR